LGLAALLATLSAGPAAAAEPTPVKTIKQLTIYLAPVFVASAKGMDVAHGEKFEFVDIASGGQIAPTLVSGEVDVTTCILSTLGNLWAQGKHAQAFYLLLPHPTVDLVIRKGLADESGISPTAPLAERIRVLKGRKFGISQPNVPGDVYMRAMLRNNGLDPQRDVSIVRVGTIPGLFAAMKSGQIDGFMLSPPSPQEAEETGVGKIWIRLTANEVPSLANLPYMSFCALEGYIKQHHAVVTGFAASVREAIDWMQTNKSETVAIMSKAFPNVAAKVWAEGYDAFLPIFSRTGRMTEHDIAEGFEVYHDMGALTAVPPSKEGTTWTNAYLGK
jgi:NitT/TauT family transport system substrate-binding protein